MDPGNIRQIISQIRHYKTELHNVEAKAAKNNNPDRLWRTVSAFANSSNGGLIICGLDDKSGFKTVDIYNIQKLHNHFVAVVSNMVPPLCPDITPMSFEGKNHISSGNTCCFFRAKAVLL